MKTSRRTTARHPNHRRRTQRCPRCYGNLFLESDAGQVSFACLQCGRTYLVSPTTGQERRV